MAEEIKEELKGVVQAPRFPPYVCASARLLSDIREKMRTLDYKGFLSVLEYVRSVDFPQDFKQDLETEYSIRNQSEKS